MGEDEGLGEEEGTWVRTPMPDPTDPVTWLRGVEEAMTPAPWGWNSDDDCFEADAVGTSTLRNLAPSMLAVIEAQAQYLDACEHDRTCDEEGEGSCCLEAHHLAFVSARDAMATFRAAVTEERDR